MASRTSRPDLTSINLSSPAAGILQWEVRAASAFAYPASQPIASQPNCIS